ncbi:hypothetical protein DFH06DRAFT_1397700 [Mycena polygramma]|nr:hypothetical protein DFH06DRAFT_1397700 [Mycena polygramma]
MQDPSVAQHISASLAADRARIAEIDAEIISHLPPISGDLEFGKFSIANIGMQIQELELRDEQALVQERLDSYKYPVSTLPPEIVSDIFIHFMPPYPSCPPLRGPLSPTSLTQICREWRYIALATPALWTAVSFSPRRRDMPAPYEHRQHMLDICFASLVHHRTRWECIEITGPPSHQLATLVKEPLPLLSHLVVKNNTPNSWFSLDLSQAPRLRTVVLDGYPTAPTYTGHPSVTLPWSQLTSLSLLQAQPCDCVSILQQTPNLVHCVLSLWVLYEIDYVANITLPLLESLHFDPISSAQPGLLNSLITPSLRILELNQEFLAPSPIDSLASFIDTSGCKLQEVTIYTHLEREEALPEESYRDAFPSIPGFFSLLLCVCVPYILF